MEKLIDIFFKEDVLRGVNALLRPGSNTDATDATPVSVGLLAFLAAILAFIRSSTVPAGFSLTQHFFATFTLLLVIYIIGGVVFLLMRFSLKDVNSVAAFFYVCLLAAGILMATCVLFLGNATDSFFDWIQDKFELAPNNMSPEAFSLVNALESFLPVLVVSIVACCVVLSFRTISARTKIQLFAGYFLAILITSGALYYASFDTGRFFASVMSYIGRVKI